MTVPEHRQDLLRVLRELRERAALDGEWDWFAVYDQRIREKVEHGENDQG